MEKEILWIDSETYCETPIKDGTFKYVEKVEVCLVTYAWGNGTVFCWDATTSDPMPSDLRRGLLDPEQEIGIHNSGFDANVFRAALGIDIPPHRILDTMIQALSHGMPGGLDVLCDILGITSDKAKHKSGHSLVLLFCKPQPFKHDLPKTGMKAAERKAEVARLQAAWTGRCTRETHPELWAQYIDYAKNDITSMREVHRILPRKNYPNSKNGERQAWNLDQKINQRGVNIDIDFVKAAVRAADRAKASLAIRCQEATDGQVESATQRDAVLEYVLQEYGISPDDLRKSTLEKLLENPDIDEGLAELIRIRLQSCSTSVSKYTALLKGTSSDGRVRGTLQFSGAQRSRRFGGRLFQPQNLPRMNVDAIARWYGIPYKAVDEQRIDHYLATGVESCLSDSEDLFYSDVMPMLSNCIRGAVMAPAGKKLVVSDLANIEGRVIAWLCSEDWKIQAFRDFDAGIGSDMYCMAYGKSFGVDPSTVDKAQRQIGKTQELACIAENELVLTDSGLIPIQDVRLEHKVWDGLEFVAHEGVISRGVKQVRTHDGLTATPEHKVWVVGPTTRAPVRFDAACAYYLELVQSGGNYGARSAHPDGSEFESRVYDILNCGPRNRFTVSNCLVHNCGYQGGVGAFFTFATAFNINLDQMADNAIGNIPMETIRESEGFMNWAEKKGMPKFGLSDKAFIVCNSFKMLWRQAHPAISSYWKELEEDFKYSVAHPGEIVTSRKVKIQTVKMWTFIRLPSGCYMCYPHSQIGEDGSLSFMGVSQFSRKWTRIQTSGGKLLENCIAESTKVLTDSGWKPIEKIEENDLVHDGIEFVTHSGKVFKSWQSCVSIDGVYMTPDHEVLNELSNWQAAYEFPRPYRPKIRELNSNKPSAFRREKELLAVPMRLWESRDEGGERDNQAPQRESELWLGLRYPHTNPSCEPEARHERTSGIRGMAQHVRPLPATYTSSMAQLRGAWHKSMRLVVGKFREFLEGHGAGLSEWAYSGTGRQYVRLLETELPMGNYARTGEQPAQQYSHSHSLGEPNSKRSLPDGGDKRNHDTLSHTERMGFDSSGDETAGVQQSPRRVWDIKNCGSRNRFVVMGATGPFIVHNCTQSLSRDILVSSFQPAEDAGFPIVLHVHDELICEVPDTPEYTVDGLSKIMATVPSWAPGLPLAAAGFSSYRYRKG